MGGDACQEPCRGDIPSTKCRGHGSHVLLQGETGMLLRCSRAQTQYVELLLQVLHAVCVHAVCGGGVHLGDSMEQDWVAVFDFSCVFGFARLLGYRRVQKVALV